MAKDKRPYFTMTASNPPRTDGPRPHLSAGRHLIPQRYVVGWPDGIVKVGVTDFGRRRWGPFLSRGGIMLDLAYYETLADSSVAESWLQSRLLERFKFAFSDRSQAEPYLGGRGSGSMECFRIPVDHWPEVLELARAE